MRKREEQLSDKRRSMRAPRNGQSVCGEVGNGKRCPDLASSSVLCRANTFRQVSDMLTNDRSREQTEGEASAERGG